MSFMSERMARPTVTAAARRMLDLALDRSEAGTARRFAASAFLARVMNAALGFATQIVLARWMGDREYGIYAYVWVWLLLAGGIGSLGLPVAALKFIPDYRSRGDQAGLSGFLRFVRGIALLPCIAGALAAALLLLVVSRGDALAYVPVALIALVILPLYALTDIQTGIARAYDFLDLGLLADYLVRPVLLIALAAAIWLSGHEGSAVNVMAATLAATAFTALVQGALLQRRLRARVPAGRGRRDLPRWAEASWPLLAVAGFTLLLGSTDIIVLKLFVGPEEIALYFAATKIVAIASFVSYGVSNTSAHRFAEHVAMGNRDGMADLAAQTVRWTFWPTLGVAVVLALAAAPLLSLFGPHFSAGSPIVIVLAAGLVAGAAVGPADRALAMADHGRITAGIYAACCAANVVLALILIPLFGLVGAALATALAMAIRAAMLLVATKRRLGLDMFIMARSGPRTGAESARQTGGVRAELLTRDEAEHFAAQWHELAGRALEPNTFYSPAMSLAALRHLPERDGGRILAAWRDSPSGRELVGVLPLVVSRGRQFNPFPLRRAAEFYGTVSTPLLAPEQPADILRAMLRALDQAGICAIAFPFLRRGGAVATILDQVIGEDRLRRVQIASHERPKLERGLAGEDFARVTIDPKRRRKLERQRRRLEDEGRLTFEVATAEAEVLAGVDAFLELEGSGWKGRLGTSFDHAPGDVAYIREVASAMARTGQFRVATLALNGRPIAAGLVAVMGSRAFYLKIAYDEAHAKLSPGILLTLDLTCRLLDDPVITETDSLAVADHPLYRGLWLARLPVSSEIVSTRSGGGAMFHAAVGFEQARDTLRQRSKPLRDKLVARVKRKPTAGDDSATAPSD